MIWWPGLCFWRGHQSSLRTGSMFTLCNRISNWPWNSSVCLGKIRCPMCFRNPSAFIFSALGLQVHVTVPKFYLNSVIWVQVLILTVQTLCKLRNGATLSNPICDGNRVLPFSFNSWGGNLCKILWVFFFLFLLHNRCVASNFTMCISGLGTVEASQAFLHLYI